jgi:Tfp pilus assembly protein PilO
MKNSKQKSSGSPNPLVNIFNLVAERNPVFHLLGALIVSILIYYAAGTYLISGYEADQTTLRNEVSAIITKNRQAEAVMSNEKQYNKEYAQAYRISEDARQMLPTQETISAVMEGVKVLATGSGLKVTRFSAQQAPVASTFASSAAQPATPANATPPPPTPAAGTAPAPAAAAPAPVPAATNKLFEVSVKAQVRGTHEEVMKFFAALASHERIIQIKTFSINASGRDEVVDLELSTFFSPPPDNLPAIPDEVKALAATL